MLRFRFFVYISMIFCFESSASSVLSWGDLASVDKNAIEHMAKGYISKKAPHLDEVEIRLNQISLSYHPRHGQSLTVSFLHADSMKPLLESKTLGIRDPNYPIQYYMETIEVELSIDGVPENLIYREQLLLDTKEKSLELFRKFYDSI